MSPTRVLLLRHGESLANASGDDLPDSPLSDLGRAQAAAWTDAIGEFGATAVVAGIIPGKTETLALGIWSRVQLGENSGAAVLGAVSFALGLAAMWAGERWLRSDPS